MKHVILAAGMGTRTRSISSIHKGLLKIHNRPVISYILDKLSEDTIVIVGYQKELLKSYLSLLYPQLQYVEVDDYTKGPGYSLKHAKHILQEPFVLTTVDCLIDRLPTGTQWIGYAEDNEPQNWLTLQIENGEITKTANKDKNGYNNAFIGICQIDNYIEFWEDITDEEFTSGFKRLKFRPEKLEWLDTGTSENFLRTKLIYGDTSPFIDGGKYIDGGKIININGNNICLE